MKVRYIGVKNCSIMLIDGGHIAGITPGKVLNLKPKDVESLLNLATRTPTPEWQKV